MRKKITIWMVAAVLALGGCAKAGDSLENEPESSPVLDTIAEESEQESTAVGSEEVGSVSSEEPLSEEVIPEVPKVEIDHDNLIDERAALDLAYDYLYEDSVYNGFGVYSDEIYHQGVYRWGYVVVQFAYDEDSNTPIYEKYDPDADLAIGRTGRIELLYDGMSKNELFYTFWLCSYIRDGEDWGHRSTLNFIAVSIDGKMIVCERSDAEGNEKPLEEWDWYDELMTQ